VSKIDFLIKLLLLVVLHQIPNKMCCLAWWGEWVKCSGSLYWKSLWNWSKTTCLVGAPSVPNKFFVCFMGEWKWIRVSRQILI